MMKLALLQALQTEIRRHDFSTFIDELLLLSACSSRALLLSITVVPRFHWQVLKLSEE